MKKSHQTQEFLKVEYGNDDTCHYLALKFDSQIVKYSFGIKFAKKQKKGTGNHCPKKMIAIQDLTLKEGLDAFYHLSHEARSLRNLGMPSQNLLLNNIHHLPPGLEKYLSKRK